MKFFLLLSLFASSTCFADGYSAIGAGGVVFGKSDKIAIDKEIQITEKSVNVKYKLYNEGKTPLKDTVAFPMPGITCGYWGRNVGIDDFNVQVNGKGINPKLQEKVFNLEKGAAGKIDLTARVRAAKLPLDCRKVFENKALFRIAQKKGLADDFQGSDPEEVKFVTKNTLFWEQIFPSKKETLIEHSYTPIVGEFTGALPIAYYNLSLHCDRSPDFKVLNKVSFEVLKSDITSGKTIEYTLTTAKTWRDETDLFHLILKKNDKKDFICSTIGPLSRVDDLTYEFKTKDFHPDRELTVIFGKSN